MVTFIDSSKEKLIQNMIIYGEDWKLLHSELTQQQIIGSRYQIEQATPLKKKNYNKNFLINACESLKTITE